MIIIINTATLLKAQLKFYDPNQDINDKVFETIKHCKNIYACFPEIWFPLCINFNIVSKQTIRHCIEKCNIMAETQGSDVWPSLLSVKQAIMEQILSVPRVFTPTKPMLIIICAITG